LKKKLRELEREALSNPHSFTQLYRFAFEFSKDSDVSKAFLAPLLLLLPASIASPLQFDTRYRSRCSSRCRYRYRHRGSCRYKYWWKHIHIYRERERDAAG
jgi:hypothetical protein